MRLSAKRSGKALKLDDTGRQNSLRREDLLRWLYLGRLVLSGAVFLAAIFSWGWLHPDRRLLAVSLFLVAGAFTAFSFWYTRIRDVSGGSSFYYAQVAFDVFLVTGIVHLTQGGESDFTALYIPVIAFSALLLSLPGVVLMAILAGALYTADVFVVHRQALTSAVALQLALFGVIALVTGWLGTRLRRTGAILGQVESELRELRHNTGDVLETISTGVMSVDSRGCLTYMNQAAESLLGVDQRNWIGMPVLEAVDTVAPALGSLLRRSMKDGRARARYKAVAQRDGQVVTLGVSTTVTARDGGGGATVTAIFQDITNEERVRSLSRRNERLEAVAELSASLAHEIRNPLASIRSAVEQLTGPYLDEEDRGLLQRLVVNESQRLSRLLSDFIDFSRLKIGKMEALDMARLVRDSIALARQHPEAADGVSIRGIGLDDPVEIRGDADLLHRAVFNLVLNGIQFAGPGGEVSVELERQSESLVAEGVRITSPLRLSVRDTGPGIHSDDTSRIFDPFYTTRKGGSGLGLPVVHRAVEAHRGAVFVESGEGRGAEFVIYLPTVTEPETLEDS